MQPKSKWREIRLNVRIRPNQIEMRVRFISTKNASISLQFSLFINVQRVSSALPDRRNKKYTKIQNKFATERHDDARLSDIKFCHVRSSSAPTAR